MPVTETKPEAEFAEASPSNRDNEAQTKTINMDNIEFIRLLKENIGEILNQEGAQRAIRQATGEEIQRLTSRQDNIEKVQEEVAKDIVHLKRQKDKLTAVSCQMSEKLDFLEQKTKNKTLRFVDIPDKQEENTLDEMTNFVTSILKVALRIEEIESCYRIGKFSADVSRPIILILQNETKKKEIYRARLKLKDARKKGSQPIFINEDLTSVRSLLAQKARQEVKLKKIHSTWTLDGEIYVKQNQDDKPRKIRSIKDIDPKYNSKKEHRMDTHDAFGGASAD